MEATLGILLLVGLLVLKILLIRAVWRMAGEQGKSRVLPVTFAIVFSALIVFLALYLSARERRLDIEAQEASDIK
ncbi:MAG TPA: hypothetical protein VMD58_10235 [Acidobacteriaceae bacterium]|nr:hypothetical protein [Acidobacteriaceae bacterium]